MEGITLSAFCVISGYFYLNIDPVILSDSPLRKHILEINTISLFVILFQIFGPCIFGYTFSLRTTTILIGLGIILCAFFYGSAENKNSNTVIRLWGQSILITIILFLVLNIQLDHSHPQTHNYVVAYTPSTRLHRICILDDGREVSGSSAPVNIGEHWYLDEYAGWFHQSYFKQGS